MKKTLHLITKLSAFCVLALAFLPKVSLAGDLSSQDKQFLTGYEQIRVALVADDLSGAKKAAAFLPESGAAISESKSLDQARSAFEKLSEKAITLVSGQSGFHVFHCGMANKDWVQTSTKAGNPYLGKDMAGCGELKGGAMSGMKM